MYSGSADRISHTLKDKTSGHLTGIERMFLEEVETYDLEEKLCNGLPACELMKPSPRNMRRGSFSTFWICGVGYKKNLWSYSKNVQCATYSLKQVFDNSEVRQQTCGDKQPH